MRYIGRTPFFDSLWIWSGLPIGLVLAALYGCGQFQLLQLFFVFALALDAAHLLSPMALTAAYPPLRRRALSEPVKFIAIPAALLLLPALFWGRLGKYAGYGFLVSGIWNWWHFSAQNFGIVQIYRRLWGKPGLRLVDRVVCAVICLLLLPSYTLVLSILGVPYPQWLVPVTNVSFWLPAYVLLIYIGMINVNHWLTSMALSGRVMRKWWWPAVLTTLGVSGYFWAHPLGGGPYHGLAALAYLNFGVGFAHFWLDGLIWRRDNPALQAVVA